MLLFNILQMPLPQIFVSFRFVNSGTSIKDKIGNEERRIKWWCSEGIQNNFVLKRKHSVGLSIVDATELYLSHGNNYGALWKEKPVNETVYVDGNCLLLNILWIPKIAKSLIRKLPKHL
jgi:hypothetical protein